MPEFTLDMYQTAGVAMLLFVLGRFLTTRIEFLKRCCISCCTDFLKVFCFTQRIHSGKSI